MPIRWKRKAFPQVRENLKLKMEVFPLDQTAGYVTVFSDATQSAVVTACRMSVRPSVRDIQVYL